MKFKIILLLSVFFTGILLAQHKFLEIPELTLDDVRNNTPKIQADAPAEVLYRSYHYRIDMNGNMYSDVISRVKIYNKDRASRYLNEEVQLYESPSNVSERLLNLKAITYNEANGKLEATKSDKDSKFRSKENKRYNVTRFTFPNVKDGSVLEYKYTIETPFLFEVPKVVIEEDVPVRYVEYVFETPRLLAYTINYRGSAVPKYRDVSEKKIYGADHSIYKFGYEDLPAYKNEEFVMNNENYKTAIKAELNSTMFNNVYKSYTNTWNDVRQRLKESENFGDQLKKMGAVEDVLPAEIKSIPIELDRAEAILKFVQKNYKWNEENDVTTEKGIKNLLSTKIGNTAEINLLLVMLMRSANIKANPVVLSTVKRGLLLSYAPSLVQLNYVLACIESGENIYLYDATDKYSSKNMIPPRALNYNGFILTDTEAKQINIVYPDKSVTNLTVDAKLNADGTFSGSFKDKDTKLFGMMAAEKYDENPEDYMKDYKSKYKFTINNLKSGRLENGDFETSLDFDSDGFVDAIGNKLVFNPLLFLYTQNHSFNQTSPRKAPLEFISGFDRVKKVTITLPEGFVFENVPTPKKFRTDDSSIVYLYDVTQDGNKLTVESTLTISDSNYPSEYYPAFKQIFDNITKMEGQVVTAVKK